jgi:SET domain-containing protein
MASPNNSAAFAANITAREVPEFVDVGPSGIHGKGAFAARDLCEGQRIGVYAGRRYTSRQVGRRKWNSGLTYVFALTDGTVIDATSGGNATRHFNHCCEPNCVAYEEDGAGGQLLIAFYALRDIRAGEELFLDYRLDVDESEDRSQFGCACGTAGCRGTMLAAA